ncbi:MAG TPA: VanW family protein [Propionibacteriaceae bacterium]|nr:VanW family protein [Propionibacteriaceae bacterium]
MTDERPDDPTEVQPSVPDDLFRQDSETPPGASDATETAVLPAIDASSAPAEELHPASPLEPEADQPVRPRRLWPLGVAAGILAIVGGAYVTGYLMSGDVVPRKSTVAGVEIGGLSRDAAVSKVTTELQPKAAAPITVTVEGKPGTIQPAQAGLAIDPAATVEASGVGRSWDPSHIIRVLTGGGAVEPVVTVDRAKLEAAVTTYAGGVNTKAADATLAYQGIVPAVKPGTTGLAVDVPATADAIKAAYLTSTTVTGKGAVTEPTVTTAEAEQALTTYAKPAVSGPITLDTGKGNVVITPEQIAAATTFPVENGTVAPTTDGKALYAAAQPAIKALNLGAAKDAIISLGAAGTPEITPSVDGVTLGEDDFIKAVTPLITATDNRTAKPALAAQKPAFTTEAAQALGVKEVIGEFTTNYPHAAYRNTNIGLAAKTMNGTLIKPGETFSLNKILGERTAAKGYVDGYVIVGGALVKESGGGISQSATTVFNAAFFAGMKDIEHSPHMFYIDRYPAGREATVYYGSLDLRWQNDTQYGALVQAFIKPSTGSSSGSITVRIWSTKTWEKVASSDLRKSNFTQPTTRISTNPKCEPQGSNQGFDVNYERLFYKNGAVAKTEKFFWRYAPQDKIVCA